MTDTIEAGKSKRFNLASGSILQITNSTGASAHVFDGVDPNAGAGYALVTGTVARFGPYPLPKSFRVDAIGANVIVDYGRDFEDQPFFASKRNIEGFVGSRTLSALDNGKTLRCDDSSNVTITAPASLPEGFNVELAMWSTGTVTVSAGAGTTNHSPITGQPGQNKSALSSQYSVGSLIMMKSGEFTLRGDFA